MMMASSCRSIVCLLAGLLLLVAAVLKVASPDAFLVAVRHALDPVLRLASPTDAVFATGLLTLETALGLVLVLRPSRPAVLLAAALLTLFALVLVLRFMQPGAQSCGGLGQALAESAPAQAWWDAMRNLAFAGALLLSGAPRRGPLGRSRSAVSSRPIRGAPAFTLVELLVTISLIGVLLALMFPALTAVRRQAQIIRSHAHLRQVFIATHAYTEANRDTFPRFEAVGDSFDPIRHRGLMVSYGGYFGAHQFLWMALVAPDDPAFHAMAARLPHAERLAPEFEDDPELQFIRFYSSSYRMSATLVADPSVFDEPISTWRRIDSPALLRGVRTFEITHPSRKGLFVDNDLMLRDLPAWLASHAPGTGDYLPLSHVITVFADGSTEDIRTDETTARQRVIAVNGGRISILPVISTRYGVRGVDR